jgi:hypothetical protein
MCIRCLTIFVLLGVVTTPAPAALDLPKEPVDLGAMTRMPPAPESMEGHVLRALPKMVGGRNNTQIVTEVVSQKVDTERFYPLIGPAQLVRTHYKCTVFSDAGVEVVYIDLEKLRPTKK